MTRVCVTRLASLSRIFSQFAVAFDMELRLLDLSTLPLSETFVDVELK